MAIQPKPLTNNPTQIAPEVQVNPDISFGEGLSAAFRLENTLVSAAEAFGCLLYTSPSPRDQRGSRMPSSA